MNTKMSVGISAWNNVTEVIFFLNLKTMLVLILCKCKMEIQEFTDDLLIDTAGEKTEVLGEKTFPTATCPVHPTRRILQSNPRLQSQAPATNFMRHVRCLWGLTLLWYHRKYVNHMHLLVSRSLFLRGLLAITGCSLFF